MYSYTRTSCPQVVHPVIHNFTRDCVLLSEKTVFAPAFTRERERGGGRGREGGEREGGERERGGEGGGERELEVENVNTPGYLH